MDVVGAAVLVEVLLRPPLDSTADMARSTMLYLLRAAPRLLALTEAAADSIWLALSKLTVVATSTVPARRRLLALAAITNETLLNSPSGSIPPIVLITAFW